MHLQPQHLHICSPTIVMAQSYKYTSMASGSLLHAYILYDNEMSNVCWQVRARQLWGNEIYTQDSDLVAVLMHLGYYNHVIAAPPVNALEVCNPLVARDHGH